MKPLIRKVTAWALPRKPVRALLLYSEHHGAQLADSITYRALFGVFAAVLLGFTIAASWLAGNDEAMDALVGAVDAAVPGLVGEDGLVDPTLITAPAGISLARIVSILGLLWAALAAIKSIRIAMRTLADQRHNDHAFIWVLLRNLGLALAIGVGILVSAAVTFAGTAFIDLIRSVLGIHDSWLTSLGTRAVAVVVTLAVDTAVIALLFVVLAGVRASKRVVFTGALLGGVGLTVLQQLSGLFVGGAGKNPLLASFASLIALLLWLNFSAQVILIATAYILVGVRDEADRVRSRFGAETMAQRRVRRAEDVVRSAVDELNAAREVVQAEREAEREAEHKADGTD